MKAIVRKRLDPHDEWRVLNSYAEVLAEESAGSSIIYVTSEKDAMDELTRLYPADPDFPELIRIQQRCNSFIAYDGLKLTSYYDGDKLKNGMLRQAVLKHGRVFCDGLSKSIARYEVKGDGIVIDQDLNCIMYDPKKEKAIHAAHKGSETRAKTMGILSSGYVYQFYDWLRRDIVNSSALDHWIYGIRWSRRICRSDLFLFIKTYEQLLGKRYRVECKGFPSFIDSAMRVVSGIEKRDPEFAKWIKRERIAMRRQKAKEKRKLESDNYNQKGSRNNPLKLP